MKVRSGDAEIVYEVMGDGPAVVLLHAFPLNRVLWRPVAERLASRYRVLLMDLRGHGESGAGNGPATMEKHALDLARVCDAAGIGRAVFGGVSIGGYVLLEFWRRCRERVRGLMLADTRAQADSDAARAARLQAADEVEKHGPTQFLEAMLPRILGESTQRGRRDLMEAAQAMARQMTVAGIAAVQRGMAERPDSLSTLPTISVPTLLLFGEEDQATPPAEGELMQAQIPGAALRILPRAGHVSVFEQPDEAHQVIRTFLDQMPR
jgi:pimeloyl-ACP methyl ester carboxylesterase